MTLPQALATLARQMLPEQQESLDPVQLAKSARRLQGTMDFSKLLRFSSEIVNAEGEASYELHFYRDDEGYYCITGTIKASVELICQRCLGKFSQVLETNTSLIVVKSLEQAREIPAAFDPILNDNTISLAGLIEDELLLALPTVAMHEEEDCPVKLASNQPDDIASEKKNPFAELSKLTVKKQEQKS